MKIPEWLKKTVRELIPELLAEFIGVQSLKRIINKGKEKADENAQAASSAENAETERKGPRIKHGGLFDLSDEINFFSLMGKVENCKSTGGGKTCVAKIASLLNSFPEEWQRRRFRAAVGFLNVDYDIKEIKGWEKKYDAGKLKTEKESIIKEAETKNVGVQVIISLAQHSQEEMMEICQASGILHSDFEAIKKAWKKLTDWAESQGPELLNSIRKIREDVKAGPSYKEPEPKKPYKQNFLREIFGL
jgi:hypothetical protein